MRPAFTRVTSIRLSGWTALFFLPIALLLFIPLSLLLLAGLTLTRFLPRPKVTGVFSPNESSDAERKLPDIEVTGRHLP